MDHEQNAARSKAMIRPHDDRPSDEVSSDVVARRREAIAGLQAIGRDMAARGGPVTREEILQWVQEGRR